MITDAFAQGSDSTPFLYLTLISVPLLLLYFTSTGPGLYKGFPVVGVEDGVGRFGWIDKARKRWIYHGASIVQEGLQKFPKCFQVITGTGPKIVLSGKYADEIRNDPHLDFAKSTSIDFFGTYPGFEAFKIGEEGQIVVEMVKGRLTQSLNFITEEVALETSAAIRELCGQPAEWKEIRYKPMLLQLIARVSSRVFVGPELCANKEWLEVSIDYTVQSFMAAQALHDWPFLLRPLVHFFLPECRELRRTMARTRQVLEPVVAQRRAQREQNRKDNVGSSKVADTIGWMDDVAKGKPYDVVLCQVGLSLAAIHTTSELLSGIISDLCSHPEWIAPLREEMVAAIGAHGWSKKALNEMKTVDSMMKESQRHHFGDVGSMTRYAEQAVTLSDGVRIPKGAQLMVGLDRMYDSSVFPDSDPTAFDPERFLRLRQKPGQENKWNFVTTSPEHLSFGHGKHSCPGRFFASNEVKVILAYLLVSFDWDISADGFREDVHGSLGTSADPDATAMIKLREDRGILL